MNDKGTNDEEIDLGQVVKVIKGFFIEILKLFVSVIFFFKKKAVLFFGILIIGVVFGYFWDKFYGKENYIQEVIIEPHYDSTLYIYDFIENFNANFGRKEFTERIGINQKELEGFIGATIEPIVRQTDVLDYFKNVYGEKDAHHVIEEMELEQLEDEKYRKFYKFHRITFNFSNNNEHSEKLSKIIFKILKSNLYFKKMLDFEIEKTKKNITETRKTLDFVNEYLVKINEKELASPKSDQDIVIYSKEGETPTIASLLEQKNILINRINTQERILALRLNIFNVLEYKQVLKKEKRLRDHKIILIPFVLIVIVSLFFLFSFLNDKIKSFLA